MNFKSLYQVPIRKVSSLFSKNPPTELERELAQALIPILQKRKITNAEEINQALKPVYAILKKHAESEERKFKEIKREFEKRPIVDQSITAILDETEKLLRPTISKMASDRAVKSVEEYLHSPEFETLLEEKSKEQIAGVMSANFLPKFLSALKEQGVTDTIRSYARKYAVGVAVLVALGIGGYYWQNYHFRKQIQTVTNIEQVTQDVEELKKSDLSKKINLEQLANAVNEHRNVQNNQISKLSNVDSILQEYLKGEDARIKKNKERDEKISKLEKELPDYKTQFAADIVNVEAKIGPLKTSVDKIIKDNDQKWSSYDNDRKVYQNFSKSLDDLKTKLAGISTKHDELADKYKEMEKSKTQLSLDYSAKLESYHDELVKYKKLSDNYKTQISDLDNKILKISEELKKLEEKPSNLPVPRN